MRSIMKSKFAALTLALGMAIALGACQAPEDGGTTLPEESPAAPGAVTEPLTEPEAGTSPGGAMAPGTEVAPGKGATPDTVPEAAEEPESPEGAAGGAE